MWTEIGQQLKQARKAAGLTLEELQGLTRVSRAELRALEEGQFDRLPGPFYVRSYLRSYASQVGLEPTKLLKKYRATEQTFPPGGTPFPTGESPSSTTDRFPSETSGRMPVNPPSSDRNRQTRAPSPRATGSHPGLNGTNPRISGKPSRLSGTHPRVSGSVPARVNGPEVPAAPSPSGDENRQEWKEPEPETRGQTLRRALPPSPAPMIPDSGPRSTETHPTLDLSHLRQGALDPSPEKSRSRTSGKKERKTPNFSFRWPVWVASIGALLLIPLGIWAGGILAGNDGGTQGSSRSHTITEEADASAPDGLALISRNEGKSIYEMTNNRDLLLEVKAKGKCWVQIKEHEDGGYVKDITLGKGDPPFRFTHSKSVTTDLWIFLGAPEKAEVKVNGQNINASDVIHIKKVQ
ncbi:cytoskeletal protein RodZ [Melghirimyces profundicolus]|uniref:Cytoskeletal protein RodZ n=1 Tax=Melghirimyces profundicolus TaxID=1242148 RepID=A0A2T6BG08_9BACL|nr:helix-turn-helix domain-containing protein [Melghirimyces profundicolus]PTX55002.1 cytoskeletal protein RodZ [Melghirimyces profundicolus]